MHKSQRLINHVAFVLDASWSMNGKGESLIKAADEQIKHLALRSEELSQETRVSVYYFGDSTIECLIFDMDVMRLPSIGDLYKVLYENTALIDATMKSQKDLATTSQLYGDHAFLTFVLTDGQENQSKTRASVLAEHLRNAAENWSIGFLVPDRSGVTYLERLGVLRDSVAIWDTAGTQGLHQAASAIRTATDQFMTNRTKGVRGTRSVFSTGIDAVNKKTVTANLAPLKANEYQLVNVGAKTRIDDFVTNLVGRPYVKGQGYYQLTKTEKIQATKNIVVVDKSTDKAYAGPQARDLLGLPAKEVRVKPDYNPQYDIYVQSTSFNRNLMPNTRLLVRT